MVPIRKKVGKLYVGNKTALKYQKSSKYTQKRVTNEGVTRSVTFAPVKLHLNASDSLLLMVCFPLNEKDHNT